MGQEAHDKAHDKAYDRALRLTGLERAPMR